MNQTVAAYDRYNEVYDQETVEFWHNFPAKDIEEFAGCLSGKKILDIGSGPGRDAMLLQERGLEVVCFDASVQMIERTKAFGFASIIGDMRQLEFVDASFDGVWAYTSLLHITETEMVDVLNKLHRILKPNGVLFLGMIEGEFEGNVERDNMPDAKRYFRYYTDSGLKSLVESAGFRLIHQGRYQPGHKIYLNQIYQK